MARMDFDQVRNALLDIDYYVNEQHWQPDTKTHKRLHSSSSTNSHVNVKQKANAAAVVDITDESALPNYQIQEDRTEKTRETVSGGGQLNTSQLYDFATKIITRKDMAVADPHWGKTKSEPKNGWANFPAGVSLGLGLFPIIHDGHWTLVAWDCATSTLAHYDSMRDPTGHHLAHAQRIMQPFCAQRDLNAPIISQDCPQQEDATSCGYFVIACMRHLYTHWNGQRLEEFKMDFTFDLEEAKERLLALI